TRVRAQLTRIGPVDPRLHDHSPTGRPGCLVSSTRQSQLPISIGRRARSKCGAMPANVPQSSRFSQIQYWELGVESRCFVVFQISICSYSDLAADRLRIGLLS